MNATIVSLLPFPSEENKPSLIPPYFHIPGCNDLKEPVFISIPDCSYIEYIPLKGPRSMPIKGEDVAKAIVNDKLNSIFGRDPEKGIVPGLTYVEGDITSLKIFNAKHPGVYDALVTNQLRWYDNLVKLADDDWTKYKQHRMINDLQRFAARQLGIVREWVENAVLNRNTQCPFCGEIISAKAIKCLHCGEILDVNAYSQLKKQGNG